MTVYKRTLEGSLRNLFAMNGYQEIETPGVEYCDVYSATGFVKEEDLYKFTDQKEGSCVPDTTARFRRRGLRRGYSGMSRCR